MAISDQENRKDIRFGGERSFELAGTILMLHDPEDSRIKDHVNEFTTSLCDLMKNYMPWHIKDPADEERADQAARASLPLMIKMLERNLTEREYNDVINGTHPDLKEYAEFKQASNRRIERYHSLPRGIRTVYGTLNLQPYDKAVIKAERERISHLQKLKEGNE